MNTTTVLNVQGMTCMGCVNSVKKVLLALPGVSKVDVVLEQGKVTVQHDPKTAEFSALKNAIEDAGYEVQNPEAQAR